MVARLYHAGFLTAALADRADADHPAHHAPAILTLAGHEYLLALRRGADSSAL